MAEYVNYPDFSYSAVMKCTMSTLSILRFSIKIDSALIKE